MYLDFGPSVVAYVQQIAPLMAAIGGNVLPDFSDQYVPALVYSWEIDSTARTYAEGTRAVYAVLVLSVVAEVYDVAVAAANIVQTYVDNAFWTDSNYTILSCDLRGSEEETYSRAGKNDRLSVISLTFDLTVKQA
jgi:hypothetical protein